LGQDQIFNIVLYHLRVF